METSSSSSISNSDEDSSSSSEVSEQRVVRKIEDDSSSSSSSDEESSREEDARDGDDFVPQPDVAPDTSSHEESDDSDTDSDDSEKEAVEDLPVAERIKRQQEQSIDMGMRRERKSQALKIASERLAKLRSEKTDEVDAKRKTKKRSKHAPTEVSSRRVDFFKRKPQLNESGLAVDVGAHRYKPRDPRVSSLSGHLDIDQFERNYGFLEEMRDKEIAQLRKKIAARKAGGKKGHKQRRHMGLTQDGGSLEEDEAELKRLIQEKASVERNQIERAAKRTVKKKLHQEVAEGKRGAYFLKRKEMKRLQLEAKFEEIRKRGGDKAVEKLVAKRRKKNKSRDAGKLGGADF